MRTRAAIAYRRNAPLVVEELELDPPQTGQVLVKLAASGVCHSDLSAITGTIPMPLPFVVGHEGAGTVVEVGPGVRSVRPGDRVMLSFITPCGRCRFCTVGRPNLCLSFWLQPRGGLIDGTKPFHKDGRRYNMMTRTGTLSEYTVVSEQAVVPVPPGTPLDRAALLGCAVTTGVGAVLNTAKVEPGSTVAVLGAGGVGINVVQGARLAHASRVIVVDRIAEKLEAARRFGATDCVDASLGDPVQQVLELTEGEGVDYAFEAIGNPTTIEQAFRMLRFGGTAVVIGIAPGEATISVPASLFPYGERRLIGSMYGSARMRVDMLRYLQLYFQGQLLLDELVSRTYTLDQVNEAFDDLRAGRNIRGVVVFEET
ncbi:MAG: alcohol dehydrogenase [Candidatus Poribacteria bacterium]|nr:MAG: alcohol dehydrogenase [Candidatus Poribacteria bacterium]